MAKLQLLQMSQNDLQSHNFNVLLSILPPPKLRKQKHLIMLQKYLLDIPIFEKVLHKNGNGAIRDIVCSLLVKTYQPDEIVYKLPEDIRSFNYIVNGVVYLYTDSDNGLENKYIRKKDISQLSLYKRLYTGDYFGDKVFTTGRKTQIVCAKTTEKTMVISLNLITLHKSFQGIFAFKELEWIIELLRNVAIFSKIPSKKIEVILENSKRKKFTKGHVLFTEGSEPGNLLVILEGEVTLRKRVELASNDQTSVVSRNFDLSILSKFDTVGIQQILGNQPYYSTAICESDLVQILEIQQQIAKQILGHCSLSRILDKNKQIWRRKRVIQLQSTVSKSNFSPSIQPREQKTPHNNQILQFTLEDRKKLSFNEDKYRPSNQRKMNQRLSLPQCRLNQRSKTQKSTIIPPHRDKSADLFQQYIIKKSKGEQIQVMKYAYSKTDKSSDDIGIVKPLYVRKSQAIKNTMRQIKISRKHIYSYMLRLTESLT